MNLTVHMCVRCVFATKGATSFHIFGQLEIHLLGFTYPLQEMVRSPAVEAYSRVCVCEFNCYSLVFSRTDSTERCSYSI